MHQFQRSWVQSQHSSAQWNLKAANEAVLNIIPKKNLPIFIRVQNFHLTRSLLEERIDVELELELGHVQVLDVLLDGGAALDPLPGLLLGVVRVSSTLL
jgi:hypothetical protein